MQLEVPMRSSWLDKWFRPRSSGGHGPARSVTSAQSLRRRSSQKRGVRAIATATSTPPMAQKKNVRLCLGIGDGTLRTQ